VAIASGGVSIQTTSANGDTIWGFSLKGSPGDRLRPFAAPKPPETVVGFVGPVVKASTVALEDYRFNPARITVAAGTKVTFSNTGTQPHNAASPDAGGWDTGLLARGESASVTFNRPGTYSFTCTPHPSMIGEIIVTGRAMDQAPATVVESPAASSAQPEHGAH
jgi:plastocyanin